MYYLDEPITAPTSHGYSTLNATISQAVTKRLDQQPNLLSMSIGSDDGCSWTVKDIAAHIDVTLEGIRRIDAPAGRSRASKPLSEDYTDEPITMAVSEAAARMHAIPAQPDLHTTAPPGDVSDLHVGIDAKHRRLIAKLMQQPSWSPQEFGDLARQFGLMPDGALETINEWSSERWDDILICDDENGWLELNPDLSADLRSVVTPPTSDDSDTTAAESTASWKKRDVPNRPVLHGAQATETECSSDVPVTNEQVFARLPRDQQRMIMRMMEKAQRVSRHDQRET